MTLAEDCGRGYGLMEAVADVAWGKGSLEPVPDTLECNPLETGAEEDPLEARYGLTEPVGEILDAGIDIPLLAGELFADALEEAGVLETGFGGTGRASTNVAPGITPVPAGMGMIPSSARLRLLGETGPVPGSGAACAIASRALSASNTKYVCLRNSAPYLSDTKDGGAVPEFHHPHVEHIR
jgi:hypothetical protein